MSRKQQLRKKTPTRQSPQPKRRPADLSGIPRLASMVGVFREHENNGISGIRLECIPKLLEPLVGKVSPDEVMAYLQSRPALYTIRKGRVFLSPELLGTSYFDARRRVLPEAKRAVAAHIRRHYLRELDAVLLDAGSACEAVALEMVKGTKGRFTVITNNMRALRPFMSNRHIRVHVTGGFYQADDEALIGDRAIHSLQGFFVRHAIVGVSGISMTHVYCHGIEGEEKLKKAFWTTPAEILIVPATLEKFGGGDACCFGRLWRAGALPEPKPPANLDDIARRQIEADRRAKQASAIENSGWIGEADVPMFRASQCIVVIEPQLMIKSDYKKEPERMRSLLAKVEEVNYRRAESNVGVVFADELESD